MEQRNWHAIDGDEALRSLDSQAKGLAVDDSQNRLQRYGTNELPQSKPPSAFTLLLRQFHNLLIYVLIAAGIITGILGHWVETGVILVVVVINAIVGFFQEYRAENALAGIRKLLISTAHVIRAGKRTDIDSRQLVPGDIVVLKSGDKVPADVRLLETKTLQVQEAALTGESMPVDKDSDAVEAETVINDRTCMAYAGTYVVYGHGKGVITSTGSDTAIGQIASLVEHTKPLKTPLMSQLNIFARWLTLAIIALTVVTFFFGWFVQSYAVHEIFMAAVGLAVAAIPEGLPAVLTVTLALGVTRIARQNAIIRQLPAVETLGSVTVVCTDKTGTLTSNQLMAQRIITADETYYVETGNNTDNGRILRDQKPVEPDRMNELSALMRAGILCNEAQLELGQNGQYRIHGSPTEGALLVLANKAGVDIDRLRTSTPSLDIIPFESVHKFMATMHHTASEGNEILLKGAPDVVLPRCNHQLVSDGSTVPCDPDNWQQTIHKWASEGYRLLALARKPLSAQQQGIHFSDVEDGLVLLGMVAMVDPPGHGVYEAIEACRRAGIAVKMITGDHAATAAGIARQLNIPADEVITGQQLDQMSDDELYAKAPNSHIFARVSPEHKLRLVNALQTHHERVAMTGDGVNDAPALRQADIGIAMGQKGTEAAKEASEMVLTDDNFASITAAIKEGRTVYQNLKKSILFMLPTNGAQTLTIMLAVIIGTMLPISALQILWVNTVTTVTLALALAFEGHEAGVMSQKPRPPDQPILTTYMTGQIVLLSFILVSGVFGLFEYYDYFGFDLGYSRSIAVNVLVMGEALYLVNCRKLTEPCNRPRDFIDNRFVILGILAVIILQSVFTYFWFMQLLFETQSLRLFDWVVIAIWAVLLFCVVEAEKWFYRLAYKTG